MGIFNLFQETTPMSPNNDSIIYSAIRSFFKGFFSVVGFFVALTLGTLAFIAIVTSNTTGGSADLSQTTTTKILPDANGVRTVSSSAPILLVLKINGVIGADELTMDKVRTALQESQEGSFKDRVKGLLVYINSPGGTVTDSAGIYQALKEYKARYKVPIYAYTEGLCASGGMYIACAAEKIFSDESALIGSVGVLFPTFMNFTKVLEKVGVDTLTITAGKGKDEMNPLRPWKPGEDDSYKAICDQYYQIFLQIVTSNRPELKKEKLINDYGAHVFLAAQAKELGYIDAADMQMSDAVKLLAEKAGVEGTTYQVVELKLESLFYQLLQGTSTLFTGTMKHQIDLGGELNTALSGQYLYLYRPE
jgi:protease IV